MIAQFGERPRRAGIGTPEPATDPSANHFHTAKTTRFRAFLSPVCLCRFVLHFAVLRLPFPDPN
jgi:hypothetical protein